MLSITYTNKMKRDVKRLRKQGKDMSKLEVALGLLARQIAMPPKYLDHPLKGELAGFRECHIGPDWLVIYRVFEDELVLAAAGTGSHQDLFDE